MDQAAGCLEAHLGCGAHALYGDSVLMSAFALFHRFEKIFFDAIRYVLSSCACARQLGRSRLGQARVPTALNAVTTLHSHAYVSTTLFLRVYHDTTNQRNPVELILSRFLAVVTWLSSTKLAWPCITARGPAASSVEPGHAHPRLVLLLLTVGCHACRLWKGCARPNT